MREGDRGDRVFVSVLKPFEKVLKSETITQCRFVLDGLTGLKGLIELTGLTGQGPNC